MWLEIEDHEQIIHKIHQTFFDQTVQLENIGLTLLNYIIINTTAYKYNLGYLQFRKLMNTFQNNCLNNIITHSVKNISKVFSSLLIDELNLKIPDNMNILKNSIKLYLSCVSFNFNVSYFEYDHEGDTSDSHSINFPLEWKFLFCDIQFYQNLFQVFVKLNSLNLHDLSIKIVYCITKMVGV